MYLNVYSFPRLDSREEITTKTKSITTKFINEKHEEALSQNVILTHTLTFNKVAKGVATCWTLIPKYDLKELGAFDD